MALEDIQNAVLSAARKEAERIVAAARKTAQDRLDAGLDAARHDAERRFAVETRAIEEDLARRVVQYKGSTGKQLLERRNDVLRRVFAEAQAEILGPSNDMYAAVMRRLLERACQDSGGRVRVHEADREMFRAMLGDVNAGRPDSERVNLDEDDSLTVRGGFVFISDTFEVDQTLETILSDLEHELSPAIASALFSLQGDH